MNKNIVKATSIDEQYIVVDHPTGLKILLCPMKGYSTSYAMFGTNYGSINTCFKTNKDSDYITVPEGIAHFLEHKLFESEEGDAFERYAKTGASANAFTSFDKTCYLFACSDNFKESLEILLDFVQNPYFTQETVDKEQGIIGQEIRMYDDNPDWRVYFNLLGALYTNNPVRVDIAGTTESIAKIDAELLYRCYHTFYNLNNMVLTIAGNFDVDEALEVCEKTLKQSEPLEITNKITEEPEGVCKKEVSMNLPVSIPLFQIGFKGKNKGTKANFLSQIMDEVLLELVAGESTDLYEKLYSEGLINDSFDTDTMAGHDYSCCIFSGESRYPLQVRDAILEEVENLRKNGIDREQFELIKKSTYGRYVGMLSKVDSTASILTSCHFADTNPYEVIDFVANLTIDQLKERLKETLDTEKSSISIVKPIEKA